MKAASYLLVQTGGRRIGLPIAEVIEVVEPGRTYPVPTVEPAVRGVAHLRGRIVPVMHLGALLGGSACPVTVGDAGVLMAIDGRRICLEVEVAESVVQEKDLGSPVPSGASLPWAVAVVPYEGGLVPLLDLRTVAGALTAAAASRLSEAQSA